jgi:hypothetical protein
MTFFNARKTIFDEKTALNVGMRLVNPACIAGVLSSRPNRENGPVGQEDPLRSTPTTVPSNTRVVFCPLKTLGLCTPQMLGGDLDGS